MKRANSLPGPGMILARKPAICNSPGADMARALSALLAATASAAAVYFLDARHGGRRRAAVGVRYVRLRARLARGYAAVSADARNRWRGFRERSSSATQRVAASDDTISQRVRSTLGRCVAHPRAVRVVVRAGHVQLSGDVLAHEHPTLLAAVQSVTDVNGIDDALTVHRDAGRVPALQGGRRRRGPRAELLRDDWGPALRALVGSAGAGLLVAGVARGRVLSTSAGALILARALANRPLAAVFGLRGPGAVRVQKTLTVQAPVDRVYRTLRDYDHFPRVMDNVRRVEVRADGTSHWQVAGPAGLTVVWDAITTALEENRLIAWATTEDSAVQHTGTIRLSSDGSATRIHVTLDYTPPAGALGHAIASLFGADARSELDHDLQRLKRALEAQPLAASHDA